MTRLRTRWPCQVHPPAPAFSPPLASNSGWTLPAFLTWNAEQTWPDLTDKLRLGRWSSGNWEKGFLLYGFCSSLDFLCMTLGPYSFNPVWDSVWLWDQTKTWLYYLVWSIINHAATSIWFGFLHYGALYCKLSTKGKTHIRLIFIWILSKKAWEQTSLQRGGRDVQMMWIVNAPKTNDVDAPKTIDLFVVWRRLPEEVVKPEFSVCVFSGEDKIH